MVNTVRAVTVEVACWCARQPSCLLCQGVGTITRPACRRCGGIGREGGAGKCLDCRGEGWRPLDAM